MKRIALVHDWLVGMRGGEKVFEVLCELFPDADVFTIAYEPSRVSETIRRMRVHAPTLTAKCKFLRRHYRWLLPIMPSLIEEFDLKDYDLIISTSHCVAKGVKVPEKVPHLCYCFTPMRYIWDKYNDYFGSHKRLAAWVMPFFVESLREWDVKTSASVRQFITSSEYVRDRIRRYYMREAIILPPPVDCARFALPRKAEDYYLLVGALEPYKRVDVAVRAFNELGLPLKIVGTGSEARSLAKLAGPNVEFVGWVDDDKLPEYYAGARAFVFPSDEDFGIVPLEAAAAGCPVIAYRHGGALETVKEGKTGVFFDEQTPESLAAAVRTFEPEKFDESVMRNHAALYNYSVFRKKISDLIDALSSERTVKFQTLNSEAEKSSASK